MEEEFEMKIETSNVDESSLLLQQET